MKYTALYRKFRPQAFDDVKGQEHIVTTLRNQVKSGRIGHAYLFCGTRGTGKTTIAKVFAKAVNCLSPVNGSPCGECEECRRISSGAAMNVIEIDAASNSGVDNIREIISEVSHHPAEGKYLVYIIDEVHVISPTAFNALLKTLEEPPEYVIFILATTEKNKIPITVASRCQKYEFRRIPTSVIFSRLQEITEKEGLSADEKGLRYIALSADGSLRDALSILDRCISCGNGETLSYNDVLGILGTIDSEGYIRLLKELHNGNVSKSLSILSEFASDGKEMSAFVKDFVWLLRNILIIKNTDNPEEIVDMTDEAIESLKAAGKTISDDTLMRYIEVMSELDSNLRQTVQKRVMTEIGLIRLCRPQMNTDDISLRERLRVIEEKIEKGLLVKEVVKEVPAKNKTSAPAVTKAPAVRKPVPADLKRIRDDWNKLLDRLEEADPSIYRIIKDCKPCYPNTGDTVLVLVVDTDTELAMICGGGTFESKNEMLEKPTLLIGDLITEIFGVTVRVEIKSAEEGCGDVSEIPDEKLLQKQCAVQIDVKE